MMNVTLDTNCIIDLEEGRDAAPYIKVLIDMHENRRINLRVVAISASERKPGGKYASNFAEFKDKIATVGLANAEILKPIGYWGITFWDWCVWAGDDIVDLERKIHEILLPNIDFIYGDFCRKHGLDPASVETDKRWRNATCDVLALWSHIYHGGGIFVTTDRNFHKKTKKYALIDLGAGNILRPKDTVARLSKRVKSA